MEDIPAQIGRYTVAHRLGSGGMGEVFLAYSPAGSPVAVKVIRSDRLDEATRARFEREALIARTVIGTNRVARFLDADPYARRPWLAMEYVAGATLLDHIESEGVLPLPLVASLGALLAEGLAAVHEAGLLHRDLKPQNIILGTDGPMIIDFGLAALVDATQDSLSHPGMIIGTVRCMPPEQAGGNPRVTPAADVYALGTVLLYAAASHYPYEGRQWQAIAAQVTNSQVAPDLSGVPATLVPLIESMLAYEPQDRPTVTDVAASCAGLLGGAGLKPADARLALVARTAGRKPAAAEHRLSPSIEARLDDLLPSSHDIDRSPLDGPLSTPVDEPTRSQDSDSKPSLSDPQTPERTVLAGTSVTSLGHEPIPRRGPDRPPASSRVADELRRQYGVQISL
ncbi:serine/threonine-protein kinase [Micromonospora sp. NPDC000207]|uniref:serine/threonine-protein kinase n=1 Tax=Micromonospora sp. NPDC000207 TaxID=3154246 RepID=UPI00331C6944